MHQPGRGKYHFLSGVWKAKHSLDLTNWSVAWKNCTIFYCQFHWIKISSKFAITVPFLATCREYIFIRNSAFRDVLGASGPQEAQLRIVYRFCIIYGSNKGRGCRSWGHFYLFALFALFCRNFCPLDSCHKMWAGNVTFRNTFGAYVASRPNCCRVKESPATFGKAHTWK